MDNKHHVILLLTSWTLLVSPAVSKTTCGRGWFGSLCQYKCRCETDACTTDGVCANNSSCQKGWFGPACQYADLAHTSLQYLTHPAKVVMDGDDNTCITSSHLDTVAITLNTTSHFTWLRVRLNNSDLVYNLTVHFGRNANVSCTNSRTSRVDAKTVDIHCDLIQRIQEVILSGQGIRHLCSVYISGGRNVALKQTARQSTTITWENKQYPADKAVDGNESGNFFNGNSCSHTETDKANPYLNVTFSRLHHVTRYVLYNRNDNQERLKGFVLRSFGQSQVEVCNFTDTEKNPQQVYTVIPDKVTPPIHLAKVTASTKILTLCELEVFGDSACQAGQYGRECENTCNCAGSEPCFVSTGGCPSGCAAGFQGEDCNTPCDPGSYGPQCQSSCSQFCVRDNNTRKHFCDATDGTCLHGCQSGYQGPTCTEEVTADDNMVIVAVVVAVLVVAAVITLVVVAFLFCRRHDISIRGPALVTNCVAVSNVEEASPSKSEAAQQVKHGFQPQKAEKRPEGNKVCGHGIYCNTSCGKNSTVISLYELADVMMNTDRTSFENQFSLIPVNQAATMIAGLSQENRDKNRYKNICPYDHSRVHLLPNEEKNQGDYINACYVEGYKTDEKFIASQGPTKTMLEDFLRMLWEQEVDKVVMLTNLVENGKHKCERYWPEEGDMKVGEMTVRLTTTQVFADYTIRRLQLRKESQPMRSVIQFHFTAWPDKDVPTTPWGLVDFEQRVASHPTNKPIVVHCSAGVGRTGTFIALRNVMREAEETGHMDFFTTVQKLRHDRVNMVQTVNQYIFLHRAAQVAMLCIGTSVTLADVERRIQTLEAKSKSTATKLEQEFQAICSVCEDNVDESTSEDSPLTLYENSQSFVNTQKNSQSFNTQKNRFPSILPREMYRAVLSCDSNNTSDYINAVLVPSFTKQNQKILTQLPLPSTITDLWRLVTQYKVTLMVAFETDKKFIDQTVADYLPSSDDVPRSVGEFRLRTETETTAQLWKHEAIYITKEADTDRKAGKRWDLTHVTCTTNLDPASLLSVTQHVRSLKSVADGRTLYMCRNGADYSGLVCVLSLLLDRMDNDHHLTVPLVVGAIKAIRPQVIATLDHYRLLYKVLQLYGHSVNEYSNFRH